MLHIESNMEYHKNVEMLSNWYKMLAYYVLFQGIMSFFSNNSGLLSKLTQELRSALNMYKIETFFVITKSVNFVYSYILLYIL